MARHGIPFSTSSATGCSEEGAIRESPLLEEGRGRRSWRRGRLGGEVRTSSTEELGPVSPPLRRRLAGPGDDAIVPHLPLSLGYLSLSLLQAKRRPTALGRESLVLQRTASLSVLGSVGPERGRIGEIPKRFLQRHGSDLPGSVFLKVPSSTTVWPVELEWSGGMARLGQGWQKFTDHYSIGFGQFLVFRYEPSSVFHVVIFDKSASEIEYPTDPVIMDKTEPECELPLLKKEETDDISATISEGCRPSPKIRKKSKHDQKVCKQSKPCYTGAHRCDVPCPAALEMACDFKSKHPTFIVVVYPSFKNSTAVRVSLT
ncbi:hypothetical protein NL676_009100 [Syzygium grande]|nr:hypothetical protein NL676_009100 [Syzygium grande]